MKKKIIVLSLGGSLIIPDEVNYAFLRKFKQTITRHSKKHKFLIICGGGSIARKYIYALKKEGLNERFQSFSGISATRMNARFMNYFFGIDPEYGIPHTKKTLEAYTKKRDIIFLGALEYMPKQTSDSTASEVAEHFKTVFINLTDVPGLYDKNPKEFGNAKLIPRISWKDFFMLANRGKYRPGQHFVLDQTAAGTIMRHKIPTYILGKDMNQLDNVLAGKKFIGTLISG